MTKTIDQIALRRASMPRTGPMVSNDSRLAPAGLEVAFADDGDRAERMTAFSAASTAFMRTMYSCLPSDDVLGRIEAPGSIFVTAGATSESAGLSPA